MIDSFNADDPAAPPFDSFIVSPDIEITGEINTLGGTVRMRSEGSIVAFASINASRLDILARQDFVLNALGSTLHTGGDPAGSSSSYAGVAADAESAFSQTGTTVFPEQNVVDLNSPPFIADVTQPGPDAALADTSRVGNIVSGNIISITASRIVGAK